MTKPVGFQHILSVFCIEIVILCLFGFRMLHEVRENTAPIHLLQTEYPEVYVPDRPIAKGTYTLLVDYECGMLGSLEFVADNGLSRPLYSNALIHLYAAQTHKICHIKVLADCQSFRVLVHSSEWDPVLVDDISMMPNAYDAIYHLSLLACFFFFTDLLFLLRNQIWQNRRTAFALTGIILFASLPLLIRGSNFSMMHDLEFHLIRIEGIAEEIRAGHFPVKIESIWADGYGYANAVFYGDILLYFPALLRLAGFPIDVSYRCYVLFVNILTCIVSYYSFRKVFGQNRTATLLTFLYCSSTYRFVNLYVRAAVGEYSAMAFLPLIFMVMFMIYARTDEIGSSYPGYALLLAYGMSGLLGTHILTAEMTVFVMACFCLLFIRKTIRPNVLKLFVLAVGITLLLNAYFIVPFLDYYLNCPVMITSGLESSKIPQIQHVGAYLMQYFHFVGIPFGDTSELVSHRMMLTPGLMLMLSLLCGCLLTVLPAKLSGLSAKSRKYMILFLLSSLCMLWIASDLFPWDFLAAHSTAAKYLAQVQFPWRYLGMAILFLTMLSGFILLYLYGRFPRSYLLISKMIMIGCACMCIGFTICYAEGLQRNGNINYYYDTSDLNLNQTGGHEYILANEDAFLRTGQILCGGLEKIDILEKTGNHYELSVKCLPDEEGMINLPLYNYKGYRVTDALGNAYPIDDNASSSTVCFHLPAGFDGIVSVRFAEPWYWRAGELLSLFSLLGTFLLLSRTQKR